LAFGGLVCAGRLRHLRIHRRRRFLFGFEFSLFLYGLLFGSVALIPLRRLARPLTLLCHAFLSFV
jgi:hypothetical protein